MRNQEKQDIRKANRAAARAQEAQKLVCVSHEHRNDSYAKLVDFCVSTLGALDSPEKLQAVREALKDVSGALHDIFTDQVAPQLLKR